MSSADLFEDGFPHGTVYGYKRGCRGSACPAELEHGLSCKRANQLQAGDYQYSRLVAAGKTPAEIAAALHEAPHTPAPVKRTVIVPDDDTDDVDLGEAEEQEEPIMPTPKDVAETSRLAAPKHTAPANETMPKPAAPAKPGPSQSMIREWARANGVDVNQRGSVRTEVVDAYKAAHAGGTAAAVPEPAPVAVDPVLVELNAAADLEPDFEQVVDDNADWQADWPVTPSEPLDAMAPQPEQASHDVDALTRALEFVLQQWAAEQRRADAAILDLAEARGTCRLYSALLEQAEEALASSRDLATSRSRRVLELEEALQARTWWKRAAS